MPLKLARGSSCARCRRRKIRCDLARPCTNCIKAGVECQIAPAQPLQSRVSKYEATDTFQEPNQDQSDDPDLTVTKERESARPDARPNSPSVSSRRSKENYDEVLGRTHGTRNQMKDRHDLAYHKQYEDGVRLLNGNSGDSRNKVGDEEEDIGATHVGSIHLAFAPDPFMSFDLTALHPPAMEIFQLWQTYMSNVEPLLKLFHVPSLQRAIVTGVANVDKLSRAMETVLFNIYLIATVSLTDEETLQHFGRGRQTMLDSLQMAAKQSLINAAYMRSSDLMVLQAYILYLYSIWGFTDHHSHFCLVGVAVRIATRMGLHKEMAIASAPAFELEMRRRVWWNLVALDKRIAELSGTTGTAISIANADCERPLNVNDSNMHEHCKEIRSAVQPTEMVFVLAKMEIVRAALPDPIPNLPSRSNWSGTNGDLCSAKVDRPSTLKHLTGFCNYVEHNHLSNLDTSIPLHLFTRMMIRQSLCKMHILSNLSRIAESSKTIPARDGDWLLIEAIRMLECDNTIQLSNDCQGFLWYTRMNSSFPAYLILAYELQKTCGGKLCERAWDALAKNYQCRGLTLALRSTSRTPFNHLFLQAWAAYELYSCDRGRVVVPPEFILHLRDLASQGPAKPASKTETKLDDANLGKAGEEFNWDPIDELLAWDGIGDTDGFW